MIIQMHWQFIKTGKTEFRAQAEITGHTQEERHKQKSEFVRNTQKKHPLPKGAIWMLCNEMSKHFVRAPATTS